MGSIAGVQLEIVSSGFLLRSGLFPLAKLLCLYPCANVPGTVTVFTVPTEDVAERGANDARNTHAASSCSYEHGCGVGRYWERI
jgi:hypothetical protein